jgi:predicted phosphodiesterase
MLNSIGLLGDIHTEHERLALAIAHLKTLSPDKILCVGDIVDGPGEIDVCCQLLQQHQVEAVSGNHERWFFAPSQSFRQGLPDHTPKWSVNAESYAFLRALPKTREYQSQLGDILLCHGLDEEDMASVSPDDHGYSLMYNDPLQKLRVEQKYSIVLNGHTHKMMVRNFGFLTIINAGTLFREHQPGFLFIDLVQREVHCFRFDGALCISLEKKEPF